MIKINYMSTLFVGIEYISSSFGNNQPDANELAKKLWNCMDTHPNLNTIVVALESKSVYDLISI